MRNRGNTGAGRSTGTRRSAGRGRGTGTGTGRARGPVNRRANTKKECYCTECGYKEAYTRGVPCTEKKCPKCGKQMKGRFCK